MAERPTSVWLPQVMFESMLIIVSILVALGLDEWREDRQDAENIEHALSNFISIPTQLQHSFGSISSTSLASLTSLSTIRWK